MLRSQILLTPDLDAEVRKISKNQNISQSEAVRKLLTLALGSTTTKENQVGDINLSYFSDLSTFRHDNQRINGFREIFSVGGKTPEIKIINDNVFRHYLINHQFPPDFEYQLLNLVSTLKQYSHNQTLVVRRAYVVPGLDNPPGPRFIGLKDSQVLSAVSDIYDFAIKNDYHLRKNSQIVVFIHPFADPKPISLLIKPNTVLPYGGYAAPLNKQASRVEVFAVWGNNEGVQSFDAIDRYVIDTDRFIILTKDIPQKNLMLCTTKKSQSEKISVPPDHQFEQVLSDTEILEISRVVTDLTKKFGLRRIEFSFDGIGNIIINESAKYQIVEDKITNLDLKGKVFVISSQKDISKLKKISLDQSSHPIIYIDKKIIESRSYDLLNSIASLPDKYTILYPGLSATAHAMRVLNDFGHTAIVVGNRIFTNGQEVLIKLINGEILIESISKTNIKNYLINLYDARLFGINSVGGKATNLSILKSKGFNVPHGWVITTNFFDEVYSKKLTTFNKLWQNLAKNIPLDPKKNYAIRSSATVEDHLEHSFAGQFATYLNIKTPKIPQTVYKVINSIDKKQVAIYKQALAKNNQIKMAVVIQEMVNAAKAGVVFGKDLQTGNLDNIVIDVTHGLGEGVVDGLAKTDRFIYSRNKNQVINYPVNRPKFLLDKIEISSLIEMANSVERLMGKTQDIEWAIDKKSNIWLIQSRDL